MADLLPDDDPFGSVPAAAPVPQRAKAKTAPVEVASYTGPITFTIHGEPASKANSREISTIGAKNMDVVVGQNDDGSLKLEKMRVGGRFLNRKSDKALAYEQNAMRQIPPKARVRIEGPVRVTLRIFYASERPDLDESVVLDVLQDRYELVKVPGKEEKQRVRVHNGVYRNDRQVREKHVYWGLDKVMPRTEVTIESLLPVQGGLL
jgi:Holliday junction resolvase RusA-like endonuclease